MYIQVGFKSGKGYTFRVKKEAERAKFQGAKEHIRYGVNVNGCEGYTSVIRTKMRNHNEVNKQSLNNYLNVCVLSSALRSMDI